MEESRLRLAARFAKADLRDDAYVIPYTTAAAARILVNSRKTILEALDPGAFRSIEPEILAHLTLRQNLELAARLEAMIAAREPHLLGDAFGQVLFFLENVYAYYREHLDALRNFMPRGTHYPAVIFQRMVCSVIDRQSYAGVLYSRHPRLGKGVFLQFGREIFGEDLMTGRLQPEERHFRDREEARREFPAVFHFWPRLAQLEDIFRAPARLLRFMAGESLDLPPAERERFEALAATYRAYRAILESVDAAHFESLQDVGHAIRYGRLKGDPNRAAFANRSFDLNAARIVRRLLDSTLGMHLITLSPSIC